MSCSTWAFISAASFQPSDLYDSSEPYSRVFTTTGIGTAWPNTSACCFDSSRARTARSLRLPDAPFRTESMSRSLSSRHVIFVPSWLITSSSIPLGRWSTTSSVTLYFRISRAMVPNIVCDATPGVRNLCASSIVMTSGVGSLLLSSDASSFRSAYLS